MAALSPQMELHENSPLLLPKLFTMGFGLSGTGFAGSACGGRV